MHINIKNILIQLYAMTIHTQLYVIEQNPYTNVSIYKSPNKNVSIYKSPYTIVSIYKSPNKMYPYTNPTYKYIHIQIFIYKCIHIQISIYIQMYPYTTLHIQLCMEMNVYREYLLNVYIEMIWASLPGLQLGGKRGRDWYMTLESVTVLPTCLPSIGAVCSSLLETDSIPPFINACLYHADLPKRRFFWKIASV